MRNYLKIFIAIAAIVSFAFVNPTKDVKPILVVIDAGHGGKDYGAKHEEYLEKEITDAIAKKIKSLNRDGKVVLKFTRDGDHNITLQERVAMINELQPDLVLSLHVSAFENPERSGAELFVANESKTAARANGLAEKLKLALEQNNQMNVRRISKAPFFLLKNSDAPAITVELGFLTNPADRKYLTDEGQQQKIAQTILDFVSNI